MRLVYPRYPREGRDFGFSEQTIGHFPLTHTTGWKKYPEVGNMGDHLPNV